MIEWKQAQAKPVIIQWREPIPNSMEGSQPIEAVDTALMGKVYAYPSRDVVAISPLGLTYVMERDKFFELYDDITDTMTPDHGIANASDDVPELTDEPVTADASDVPDDDSVS